MVRAPDRVVRVVLVRRGESAMKTVVMVLLLAFLMGCAGEPDQAGVTWQWLCGWELDVGGAASKR